MRYFDHCASTPPYDEVVETVTEVMKRYYGNPSSIHHLGVEAERLILNARNMIAKSLNIRAEEIIFTSGGTESNNLAIKGIAYQYRNRGNHLITTQVEHSSVYECFQQLEKEGYRITYLPVDYKGRVSVTDLEEALTDETILVSVMHVNNEVGTIQPIQAIAGVLKRYAQVAFHVDAIQSIGKLRLDPRAWGIDMLSVSAHKIRGPKGIGILYCRSGLQLTPLFAGGGQEQGARSGTENVPFIASMAKAIRMTLDKQQHDTTYLYELRERLIKGVEQIPEIILNGSSDAKEMAPHIVHFSLPGLKSEVIVHALEAHHIYVSTRSACASGEQLPSRVLTAMGHNLQRAASGIRVSLSAMHNEEDIDFLSESITKVVADLKKLV